MADAMKEKLRLNAMAVLEYLRSEELKAKGLVVGTSIAANFSHTQLLMLVNGWSRMMVPGEPKFALDGEASNKLSRTYHCTSCTDGSKAYVRIEQVGEFVPWMVTQMKSGHSHALTNPHAVGSVATVATAAATAAAAAATAAAAAAAPPPHAQRVQVHVQPMQPLPQVPERTPVQAPVPPPVPQVAEVRAVAPTAPVMPNREPAASGLGAIGVNALCILNPFGTLPDRHMVSVPLNFSTVAAFYTVCRFETHRLTEAVALDIVEIDKKSWSEQQIRDVEHMIAMVRAAGLAQGDVIVRINGVVVTSSAKARFLLGQVYEALAPNTPRDGCVAVKSLVFMMDILRLTAPAVQDIAGQASGEGGR